MRRETMHLLAYERGEPSGTACGKYHDDLKVTSDPDEVTCSRCKQYLKRTGNGPESLKSLLRF